jgi:hypothetical protein
MKLFTVAGFLAGIAILAIVAHRTYKTTSVARSETPDQRYSIDDLLADQEM